MIKPLLLLNYSDFYSNTGAVANQKQSLVFQLHLRVFVYFQQLLKHLLLCFRFFSNNNQLRCRSKHRRPRNVRNATDRSLRPRRKWLEVTSGTKSASNAVSHFDLICLTMKFSFLQCGFPKFVKMERWVFKSSVIGEKSYWNYLRKTFLKLDLFIIISAANLVIKSSKVL